MLDTFLRRIPVDVVLPDFQERTLEEKYELILFLIHQESKTMNTTFQVSSNVINRLLTFQGKGNIGTLKISFDYPVQRHTMKEVKDRK